MSEEAQPNSELLHHITGIVIMTKTEYDGFPLTTLINNSGILNQLSHLPVQAPATSDSDSQRVLRGGDTKEMNTPYAPPSETSPFTIQRCSTFTALALRTRAKDNYGRESSIYIGLRGVTETDPHKLWQLLRTLIPRLKFVSCTQEIDREQIFALAAQNTIVIPPLEFVTKTISPTPTSRSTTTYTPNPPPETTTSAPLVTIDDNSKPEIAAILVKLQTAYGSDIPDLVRQLSALIPDFRGISDVHILQDKITGTVLTLEQLQKLLSC